MFRSTRKYLIIALAIPAGLLAQNELASQLNDPSITRLIPAIVACDGASCAGLDKSFIRAVKARVSRGSPQTYSAIFYRDALSDQINVRTTNGIQEWVCIDVINCRFSGIPEQWVLLLKRHANGAFQVELPPLQIQQPARDTLPDPILPPPSLSKSHTVSLSATGSAASDTFSLSATADLARTHTDTQGDSLTETAVLSRTISREPARTRTSTDTRSGTRGSKTGTPSLLPDLTPVAHTVAVTGVDPGQGLGAKDVPALTWDLGVVTRPHMVWSAANAFCANKGNGWRQATVWELIALLNQQSVLGSDQTALWHSSGTSKPDGTHWGVLFPGGQLGSDIGTGTSVVRCVR